MTSQNGIPDRQIWSRAFGSGLKTAEFGTFTTPLIRKTGGVAAIGTMLAARLLAAMGPKFSVMRVDPPHPAFADIAPEADEYADFSAGYGEIWNARALRQLVRRADRSFAPAQDRRVEGDIVIDVFRPRLRYPARSDQEFDVLADRHMNAVRTIFRRCSTLIVALGGSEICEALTDGSVIPASPAGLNDGFDPERHRFRTLSVAETIADLDDAIVGLRGLNPGMAIILMISPEPIAATATPAHVVAADAHGKAVLRVAMEEIMGRPGVAYFPALEIGGTLGAAAFETDGRTVSKKAIDLIGAALRDVSEGGSIEMIAPERPSPDDADTDAETVVKADAVPTETAPPVEEIAATPEPPRQEPPAEAEPAPEPIQEENPAAAEPTPESRRAARIAARKGAREESSAPSSPTSPVPQPGQTKRVVPKVIDAYSIPVVPMVPILGGEPRPAKSEAPPRNPSLAAAEAKAGTDQGAAPAATKPRDNEASERRAAREARQAAKRDSASKVPKKKKKAPVPSADATADDRSAKRKRQPPTSGAEPGGGAEERTLREAIGEKQAARRAERLRLKAVAAKRDERLRRKAAAAATTKSE